MMASWFFNVVALTLFSRAVHAEIFAVVCASSANYENYRHQADAAHAYKSLTEGGVKAENIVTLMVDDIANNTLNPYPGQIFNRPSSTLSGAVDVYPAVKDHIDYRGADVTPDNFLAILQGLPPPNCTNSCTKRTLKSTAADTVFVYFVDHGGQGVWAFPMFPTPQFFTLLDGADVIVALKAANAKKMWNKFIFYVEACESASVFEGFDKHFSPSPLLPKNISLYTMSATNATSLAWATFCGSEAMVGAKNMGTCMADYFSVSWLANTDSVSRTTETLQQQYKVALAETTKSTVTLDGDQSFTSNPISTFLGAKSSSRRRTSSSNVVKSDFNSSSSHLISSRDTRLNMFEWRVSEAKHGNKAFGSLEQVEQALSRERAIRAHVDHIFAQVWADQSYNGATLDLMSMPHHPWTLKNHACLREAIAAVERTLGGFNGYSLQYVRVLSELCETEVSTTSSIVSAVMRYATPQPFMEDAAKQ